MGFADVTPKAPVIKTDIVIRDSEFAGKITLYGTTCQELVEYFSGKFAAAITYYKDGTELPEFAVKARGKNEDKEADKDEE